MGVWPAACHPKGLGLPTCEEGGKPRCGKASPALWLVSAQDQGADAGPGQQLPSVRSVYDSHSSPPRRGPWRPWAACPRSAGTPGGLLLPFLLCIWSEHLSRWQSSHTSEPQASVPTSTLSFALPHPSRGDGQWGTGGRFRPPWCRVRRRRETLEALMGSDGGSCSGRLCRLTRGLWWKGRVLGLARPFVW